MQTRPYRLWFFLLLLLCLTACDSSDDVEKDPMTSGGEETAGMAEAGAEMAGRTQASIQFDPSLRSTSEEAMPLRVEASDRAHLQLGVVTLEGSAITEAEWSSSDEAVFTVETNEEGAQVSAVGAGVATLTVTSGGESIEMEISVIAPKGLVIVEADLEDARPGDMVELTAKLMWSDDSIESLRGALRSSLTWSSGTTSAEVSEEGTLTVLRHGQLEISAAGVTDLGQEVRGVMVVEVPCNYLRPTGRSFDTGLELGTTLPPLKWLDAYSAMDGSTSEISMEEFYCSADYDWVSTINIMISAGWCTACPTYLRAVAALSDDLLEAGGILIYVEVENTDGDPADSAFSNRHLSNLLGSTNGYYVGDKDTQPLVRFFGRSPAIEAYPDLYVIRRSDMQILTSLNLNRQAGLLPLVSIAENPQEDWTTIMPPPFESTCEEGDDEPSEPNDDVATATPLEPGMYAGGICTEAPDFYQINLEGDWSFRVDFSHGESDIDLAQVNPDNPIDIIQESNSTMDFEVLTGTGPATIKVFSFNNASALYTLTLEAL